MGTKWNMDENYNKGYLWTSASRSSSLLQNTLYVKSSVFSKMGSVRFNNQVAVSTQCDCIIYARAYAKWSKAMRLKVIEGLNALCRQKARKTGCGVPGLSVTRSMTDSKVM